MKSSLYTHGALLAFSLWIALHRVQVGASSFVPARCLCPVKYETIHRKLKDFTVIAKGSHCSKDEILVRLESNDKEVCLNPEGQQGKRLLRCWKRIKKNGGNKKKCLRRRKARSQRRRPRQNKKRTTS